MAPLGSMGERPRGGWRRPGGQAAHLTYFPYSRQKKQRVTMFQLVLLL